MALMKVKSQLNDYSNIKLGLRNNYLIIEGNWQLSTCKWKLNAIE